MMKILERFQAELSNTAYQRSFDQRASEWATMLRNPKFKGLLKHFEREIDFLHRELEKKDDINARAEIKVYRKILQLADTYATNKE